MSGILERNKKALMDRWFQAVADSYPADTSLFLRTGKDRFANPAGYAIQYGLTGLFEGLVSGADSDGMAPFLDEIVRLRAVQDFSPSEAVSFVFALKTIVREAAAQEGGKGDAAELAQVESGIDRLALQAFDNYMACRETLFEIKVKELRERLAVQAGRPLWRTAGSGGARVQKTQGETTMKRGES